MFRKADWLELGGMSISSTLYWEDVDLSYRLGNGKKSPFEPLSQVVHEQYHGAIKSQYTSKEVRIISFRNQFFFSGSISVKALLAQAFILFDLSSLVVDDER